MSVTARLARRTLSTRPQAVQVLRSYSSAVADHPDSHSPNASLPHIESRRSILSLLPTVLGVRPKPAHQASVLTSAYYITSCSERDQIESKFFHDQCNLPPSFNSWFHITNLYLYLIIVRLRSLPDAFARPAIQELTDQMFLNIEHKIKADFKIKSKKLMSGHLKDYWHQHRGAVIAYDEGLVNSDAVLASALWRNMFGTGWGTVSGVEGKKAPQPENSDNITDIESQAQFAESLEKLVMFMRREVHRMAQIDSEEVIKKRTGELAQFSRI